MARYRAKESFNAGRERFKEGQIVDVNEIPAGCLGKFSLVRPDEEFVSDAGDNAGVHADNEQPKELVVNPDREELKKLAADMGVTFPANISTAKLAELVQTKADEINKEAE